MSAGRESPDREPRVENARGPVRPGIIAAGMVVFVALAALSWGLRGTRTRSVQPANEWKHLGLHLTLPREFAQKVHTPAPTAAPVSEPWQPLSRDASRTLFVSSNRAGQGGSIPAPSIEVLIDERPGFANTAAAVALIQQLTHGSWYQRSRANYAYLGGNLWLRRVLDYRVAADTSIGSQKRVVEYALVRSNLLYRVIFRGWDSASDKRIEDIMNASRAASATRRYAARSADFPVGQRAGGRSGREQPSVATRYDHIVDSVIILAVGNLERDRLRLASGGSGTVVSTDGAFLSNLHVVFDEERGQLYDVFFVGRWHSDRETLEFVCAGRPEDGEFVEEVDLALLRCDTDLRPESVTAGRWSPVSGVAVRAPEPGSRVLVVGFSDTNAGQPAITTGTVTERADRPKSPGRYILTDAGISAGVSGGGAFLADGQLLGVPTAYRYRARQTDSQPDLRIDRLGLIQPLAGGYRLLQLAASGWAIERKPRTRQRAR